MDFIRYGRQLILPEFGYSKQTSLANSRLLIVGVGGLGCPAALHLASAGVGTIGLVDSDLVSLSNLPRQSLFCEADLGLPKVVSARDRLLRINSGINFVIFQEEISSKNALSIISQFQIVLDCTDNVTTRYLLNDACVFLSRPLVSAAALGFEGQLTIYNFNGPCYRCLYPQPPSVVAGSCSENGIFPTVTGVMGTLQAMEAIKLITCSGEPLNGKLLTYHALDARFKTFQLRKRRIDCPVCGENPTITELKENVAETNCVINSGISVQEFAQIRRNGVDHVLLDVRNSIELEICSLGTEKFINISHSALFSRKGQSELLKMLDSMLEGEKCPIYVICKRGLDSGRVVEHLTSLEEFEGLEMINIRGGLLEWHNLVDDDFVVYF